MSSTTSKAMPLEFWVGMAAPALLAGFLFPALLLRSWVLAVLWGWYMVPAFGSQPLRIIYAFGIVNIVAFLTPARSGKNERKLHQTIGMAIAGPGFALLLGWIGTFFI